MDEPATALTDIKLLRLFDVLHGTGSVTRTAELLGCSQPTVSIWLARLRRELGDPLFVRAPGGMLPTPRADELIAPVRAALAALQRVTAPPRAFDPASEARRFRICMTDASHITLLPHLLAHVRALGAGIELEALRIDGATPRRLQAGEADLAIGLLPGLESGFYQQTLYPQDWVCLMNARHPRVGKRFGPREYAAEAHIGIAAGTGQPLLEGALRRHRIERRIVLQIPGFLGLAAILASTDLIATLPRHIGETLAALGGLRVEAAPFAIPTFTVKQHWHERYHQDPANRWLRGVCAQLFLRPPRRA